jgi:hypothetical protein
MFLLTPERRPKSHPGKMTFTFANLFTYASFVAENPKSIIYTTVKMVGDPSTEYAFVVMNLVDGKIGFFSNEGDTIPEKASKITCG